MKRRAHKDQCRECHSKNSRACWMCLGTGSEALAAQYRPAWLLSRLPREAQVAVLRAWPRIASRYPAQGREGILVHGAWGPGDKSRLIEAGFKARHGEGDRDALCFPVGIYHVPSRAELMGRTRKPRAKRDTSTPLLDWRPRKAEVSRG